KQLLSRGRTGEARALLRQLRAVGNGAAAFMLAETLDPRSMPIGADTNDARARLAYAAAVRLAGLTSQETRSRLDAGNTLLRDVAKPIGLAQGRQLFNAGDVAGARTVLGLIDTPGDADVALALARTYDPNVLAAQRADDTFADIDAAERLYRRWYAAARDRGDVSDAIVVERIVRAMRRRR
ncbi:MAG: hypothetical protein AAGF32_00240, partial [Pseudomonadota bacterium]